MKSKKYINKTLVAVLLSVFSSSLYAQNNNKECASIEVESINIINSHISVSGGNIIFTDESTLFFILTPKGKDIKKDIKKASSRLIGKDIKGNKWVVEESCKLNEKTGLYEATVNVKASKENPFIVSQVGCSITNACDETTTFTETIAQTEKKTSFAILLNGYNRPKYGQCWVFAKSNSNNSNFVNLGDLNLTQTNTEDKESKGAIFAVVIGINTSKEKNGVLLESILTWGEAILSATYTIEYENGKTETRTTKAKFNPSTSSHFITDQFAGGHNKTARMRNVTLQFITSCKDTFILNTEYQSGYMKDKSSWTETWLIDQKTKDYNPCDTKFKLKEIEYSETTVSGLYGLQFSFQFEDNSDIPDNVRMIVQLTDCKSNTKNIEITIKYNEKTGLYSGSQTISQSKECPLALTYGEIAAYNSCKDQTVWSFESSKVKSISIAYKKLFF